MRYLVGLLLYTLLVFGVNSFSNAADKNQACRDTQAWFNILKDASPIARNTDYLATFRIFEESRKRCGRTYEQLNIRKNKVIAVFRARAFQAAQRRLEKLRHGMYNHGDTSEDRDSILKHFREDVRNAQATLEELGTDEDELRKLTVNREMPPT